MLVHVQRNEQIEKFIYKLQNSENLPNNVDPTYTFHNILLGKMWVHFIKTC